MIPFNRTHKNNHSTRLSRYRRGLLNYYLAPATISFKKFRNGIIYFSVGLMTIFMANQSLPPSTAQEIIVLGGLILGGIGFLIAMTAYMRIVISRIVRFYRK